MRLNRSAWITQGFIVCCLIASGSVQAQIVPDGTLGAERSQVTPIAPSTDRIDGGAGRGANLFHSFQEFNVRDGRGIYFANPVTVQNIFSRVTGGTVSNINGTLGVLGNANLYLLNPNGIIFGPNARLDIAGSFFASTESGFTFPDGSEFSATNPQAAPLLTVSLTPGLQRGIAEGGTLGAIVNAGNLSVGKDLTLSGGTVTSTGLLAAPQGQLTVEATVGDSRVKDVTAQTATLYANNNLILEESQLRTTGDLNLLAQNTVRVRDSVANPFVAWAGGKLLVQGNQNVDVFALNHPVSGLFSGGDTVLRSSKAVGGDAHYWTGGNFRIEQLDGSVGDLFSPYDPIIRAVGNVNLGGYTGNSLHILAGGSVNIEGNVTIGGIDTGTANVNYIVETVPLSVALPDGTASVSINGNREPTLDIRAGINWASLGGLAGNTLNGDPAPSPLPNPPFLPPQPPQPPQQVFEGAQGANIRITGTVSNLSGAATGSGQIFLTNQYPNPNPIVDTSIIQIGDILTYGNVTIDSRGAITTGRIDTSATQPNQNGGSIRLIANGSITTNGDLLSQVADNTGVNGLRDDVAGNITLRAGGDINTRNVVAFGRNDTRDILNSDLLDNRYSTIRIESITGSVFINGANISATNVYSQGNINNPGYAGDIIIDAAKEIAISGSTITSEGSLGRILIGKNNFEDDEISAQSIVIGGGNTFSNSFLSSANNSSGNGGLIKLIADVIDIKDGSVLTTDVRNQAEGGSIEVKVNSLSITGGAFLGSGTYGSGNGGSISINARDSVLLSGVQESLLYGEEFVSSGIYTNTQEGSFGRGGDITVTVTNGFLEVTNGAYLSATTTGNGNAGNITIYAHDRVSFKGRDTEKNGFLSGAYSRADLRSAEGTRGGNISITTQFLGVEDSARIGVNSVGRGRTPGDITINANDISLKNQAVILATNDQVIGTESFGNITLQGFDGKQPAESLTVVNSLITASTASGVAGNINLNTRDFVQLSGSFRDPYLDYVLPLEKYEDSDLGSDRAGLLAIATLGGRAGNLTITTGQLTIGSGAQVSVKSTETGQAGDLLVSARSISLDADAIISAENQATPFGSAGGNIRLKGLDAQQPLRSLTVENSLISASTQTGTAGNLIITNADSVQLSGENGGLFVRATANGGRAGGLEITAGQLEIKDGAQINLESKKGNGAAGNVDIQARTITLTNRGQITTKNDASQSGGDITLHGLNGQPLESLTINNPQRDTEAITAETNTGRAGDITINVRDRLQATNGKITTSAKNGSGGSINVTARDIRLYGDSDIKTDVNGGEFTGGNITLNAFTILALSDSDILAYAREGRGGNISFGKTPILLTFRYFPAPRDTNPQTLDDNDRVDINATGALGDGSIDFPDLDPSQGLTSLPTGLEDPSRRIDTTCASGSSRSSGQFVITGRGGLPPNPGDPLTPDATLPSLATSPQPDSRSAQTDPPSESTPPGAIVEAQGFVRLPNGRIRFVAQAANVTPRSPWQVIPNCSNLPTVSNVDRPVANQQ